MSGESDGVRLVCVYAVRDVMTGVRVCLTPDRGRAVAAAVGEQHVVEPAWDAQHLLWYCRPAKMGTSTWAEHHAELQRLIVGPYVDQLAAAAAAALRRGQLDP